MDVDMLKKAVSAAAIPENSRESKNKKDTPAAHPKAEETQIRTEHHEARKEKPGVTLRSGKFKATFTLSAKKSSFIGMPEIKGRKIETEQADSRNQFAALKRTIERANQKLVGGNSMIQYSIHDQTNQIMIKIIDKETKDIIFEIPPEKSLDAMARMWELSGVFVDEKS